MVGGGWIGAAVAALAVGLATLSAFLLLEWFRELRRQKKVQGQLQRLAEESLGGDAPAAAAMYRRKSGSGGPFSALLERLPRTRDLQIMLDQAALDWSVLTYFVLAAGFALALGLGMFLVTRSVLYTLPLAALGAALPHLYVRNRRDKRIRAFEERLPEAIDLLGRALRAGHPLTSGLKMVADEAGQPIAGEFRRVFEEQRFGMPLDETLYGLADRVPLVDVRIFISAVLIQREVGGNLAEILDKLSSVIRMRFTLARQLRVITAQGRISGYVLGALPIALGVMMFALMPEPTTRFVTSEGGRYLMMGAVVMQIIGFLWIRKIVDIKM